MQVRISRFVNEMSLEIRISFKFRLILLKFVCYYVIVFNYSTIVWLSLPVLKGLLMRVHYPILRNIVHPISLLMFLLLPKDQTFIFFFFFLGGGGT